MGMREIFNCAGVEPPELSPVFEELVDRVVEDAATFAKYTKTAVFSQSMEVFTVEPGIDFDGRIMISSEKRGAGKVKCTIQFGLHTIDHERNRRILVMPEVLLVDT